MGGTNPTAQALASAKKALENAGNYTKSVTSGKPNAFAPEEEAKAKAFPARADYSHAREARKNPDEFMGVRSDQAPELNAALQQREQTKKALEQQ